LKTTQNISIDSVLKTKAKELRLNVSAISEAALAVAISNLENKKGEIQAAAQTLEKAQENIDAATLHETQSIKEAFRAARYEHPAEVSEALSEAQQKHKRKVFFHASESLRFWKSAQACLTDLLKKKHPCTPKKKEAEK
jgi:post-segregation antitoxin (ccd killing protein)